MSSPPPKTFQVTKWKPASDSDARGIRLGWAASLACLGIRTEEHSRPSCDGHGRPVQYVALFREGTEKLSYEGRRSRGKKHGRAE